MIQFITSIEPLILALHFMVCLFLIVVILLQAGKGADMGAAFGAGSSQTLFGARGAATLLQKITTGAALFFLLTSVSLSAIHKKRSYTGGGETVVTEQQPAATQETAEPTTSPTEQPATQEVK